MIDAFEDHCWNDVVPADVLDIYRHYRRDVFVGPKPALLVIDLYELAYQGGPRPVSELQATYPSSCGEVAFAAIPPTQRLFAAARAAGLPVFYTTGDARPEAKPKALGATRRRKTQLEDNVWDIRPEFAPQDGDVVITKQRASGFFGTPLQAHLQQLGIRSLVVCGESTSGCVRASCVDAYSLGFHVTVAEECCFDRSPLSHKVNLFDLHHKYADVLHIDEVVAQLEAPALKMAS